MAEINSLENNHHDDFDASASQRTFTDVDRPDTQESQMSIASSRSTLQR